MWRKIDIKNPLEPKHRITAGSPANETAVKDLRRSSGRERISAVYLLSKFLTKDMLLDYGYAACHLGVDCTMITEHAGFLKTKRVGLAWIQGRG